MKNNSYSGIYETLAKLSHENTLAIKARSCGISYHRLIELTTNIANYLNTKYKLTNKDRVVINLANSEVPILVILALLKLGVTYVPTSANIPLARLDYILNDTAARLLITDNKSLFVVDESCSKYETLLITDDFFYCIEMIDNVDLFDSPTVSIIENDTPAYIMYTSGSTGNPKGVIVTHGNIISLVFGIKEIAPDFIPMTLLLADIGFDAATFEIFYTLLHSGCLHICPDKFKLLASVDEFKSYLTHHSINLLWLTKTLFDNLFIDDNSVFANLEYLLVGGEALNYQLINQLCNSRYKPKHLLNGYGPTENTVFSCIYEITRENILGLKSIPIGQALLNRVAFIINEQDKLAAVGEVGELYLGGTGLSLGYLNLPSQSEERFVVNNFQFDKEALVEHYPRLYKSGDLARYLADGNIEYLGRNDNQVKINGYRIELGEIESLIQGIEKVICAVVIVMGDNANSEPSSQDKYLIAYYVAEEQLPESVIIKSLSSSLPSYMMPRYFIQIQNIPYTNNGKLDKQALPKPQSIAKTLTLKTPMEQIIAEQFSHVLHLAVDSLSPEDDFFKLGGNSIQAFSLLGKLNNLRVTQEKKFRFKLADILVLRTIHQLAAFFIDSNAESNFNTRVNLASNLAYIPLSSSQKSLWFINEFHDIGSAYQIPLVCKLSHNVNLPALEQTLQKIIEDNEIFRTLIKQNENGDVFQEVLPSAHFRNKNQIQKINCCNRNELIELYKLQLKQYKLDQESAIRIVRYDLLSEGTSYLVINIHHIAFDGWSLELLKKQIEELYTNYSNNTISQNISCVQYKDYVIAQNNISSNTSKQYWQENLKSIETLNLYADLPRPSVFNYNGQSIYFKLSDVISNKLRNIANVTGVSLFSILLTAYQLLLKCYANQRDITVGIPFANREDAMYDQTIGFFINTLVINQQLDDQSVHDLIISTHAKIINAIKHSDTSFDEVVNLLNIPKDESKNPLFQVLFSLQRFQSEKWSLSFAKSDDLVHILKQINQSALFDITTMLDDSLEEINGYFNYAVDIFAASTVESMIRTYIRILEQLANLEPRSLQTTRLSKINYIDYDHTNTLPHLNSCTIIDVFCKNVINYPQNIALVYDSQSFTYAEINQQANKIANYILLNHKLDQNSIIGLYLSRSEFMVTTILAVLKLGVAYLPLDTKLTAERLSFILKDSKPITIITELDLVNSLDSIYDKEIILKDEINSSSCVSSDINYSSSDSTAYILYTSGTTGTPKGVVMGMHGISTRILTMAEQSGITRNSKYLFKTNYTFDVSFSDIFATLCAGGTLYITQNVFDLEEIRSLIINNSIDITHFVPSQLQCINETIGLSNLPSLRVINVSGEAFFMSMLANVGTELKVVNYYGPTECGEVSYEITHYNRQSVNNKYDHRSTIGYPFKGTQLLILDEYLNLLPIGAVGELYISGVSLAKGYLHNSELTAAKFIQQSSDKNINDVLYKTGDLARYLPDGNIEYIGRNDQQVKINGFRIELKDIELNLLNYPTICQVASKVQVLENQQKTIIVYYVADEAIEDDLLIKHLLAILPDYMVPQYFVHMEALPLNSNGKLDHSKLPKIIQNYGLQSIMLPVNDNEYCVRALAAQVIGVDESTIDVNANLFSLGLTSLLAINLLYKLNHELNMQLTAFDIFHKKDIRSLVSKHDGDVFSEFDDYYEFKHNNRSTTSTTLIFVPGCEPGFERYYLNIIKNLLGNSNYKILQLKSKFTAYTNIKEYAKYYTDVIIKNNLLPSSRVILLGFSAGGEIAYFMTKILERQLAVKLVLFDSYMNHDNIYSFLRYYIKKILQDSFEEHHWYYRIPKLKSEILFLKATLQRPVRHIIKSGQKFRLLRQIKANFEYYWAAYQCKKGTENNLKPFMKISKYVKLNCYHNGDKGMLSERNAKVVADHVREFIQD